jgi:hypothetical protein
MAVGGVDLRAARRQPGPVVPGVEALKCCDAPARVIHINSQRAPLILLAIDGYVRAPRGIERRSACRCRM